MNKMTSQERFQRMFEHKPADRIPIIDDPWTSTIERWHKEGMPEDADFVEYFDLDRVARIVVDNSPRYKAETIDETDEYTVFSTPWGATLKKWKHITSTPQFIDFTIKSRDEWLKAKALMQPDKDRVPWEHLAKNYKNWREQGCWIHGELWFGFDVTHSWTVGTERLLMALVEDPEWCVDMFNHFLDVNLALLDMAWDAGYKFDCIAWPDDMGYKNKQFFSVNTYREMLKPVHKRAIDWAHAKGIKAHLHSCGDVNPFVPELIDIGLDALNPLEVKAGMNPIELKKKFGDKLVLHGGINAVLWDNLEAMEAEIKKIVPGLMAAGGYIFSSDHSVPSNVGLEDFRRIVELVKKIGAY